MDTPSLIKLKEDFDSLLKEVWNIWLEAKGPEGAMHPSSAAEFGKGPFDRRAWITWTPFTHEERESLRENLGWLTGVSEVTGWRLYKPGPREWSPRE